jgi:hypothetical protein
MPADQTDKRRVAWRRATLTTLTAFLCLAAGLVVAGCGGGSGGGGADGGGCEAAVCFESREGGEEPVNLTVESLGKAELGSDSTAAKEIKSHQAACAGGACLALAPLTVATSIAATLAEEEAEAPAEGAGSSGSCPLSAGGAVSGIPMEMPSCLLVASDTSAEADEVPFWGELGCAEASRYEQGTKGGDPSKTAAGVAQGNADYRRLTVLDGDDVYGERCELGENNNEGGPTVFYHQGEHLATYFSERLPANFPLATDQWQTVMQMKQAQPSDNGGGAPILEMEARDGRWIVDDNWHELWSAPAQKGVWTRFAWDVYYSQSAETGWLQVSIDLNGDGDFNDPGERSPVFHVKTLKRETEGPNGDSDGFAAGEPLPSHLRMGIYHDPAIPCPAPGGCSVDVDNVQVFAPAPPRAAGAG